MAITLLTTSDWPSICRWKAVLMCNLTPAILKRSRQTSLVNTGPRSLTMEVGNPWSWTTALKAQATEVAM